LDKLIQDLWKQIAVNWVEGGCQARGRVNWRWTLQTKRAENNKRLETVLEREIAGFSNKYWANQIPTASGLSEGLGGGTGHLDLAYSTADEGVVMIELKVRSNNPASAALQLLLYGLVLTLARHVDPQISMITNNIWRDAKYADLRVLAPLKYYESFKGLEWFERQLNEAVETFGSTHGLNMSFGFRSFNGDALPANEAAVIKCLGDDGKVNWA